MRDVTEDDAAGICQVANPIIEAGCYTALTTSFTVDGERQYIRAFPARGIWKVAIDPVSRAIAGFQVLEPFASYASAFDHVATIGTYVDLARRRQGVASALFPASFATARAKGFEKLFTFVRRDNPVALAAYQTHGFTVIGTASRQAKLGDRYVDELMIERML